MDSLLLDLIKCMSVVAVCAYLFSQTKTFRNAILRYKNHPNLFMAIIFFSGMSILGSYMNIPINGAIANTRSIGITLSGLIYGPVCGASVGLITGIHRLLLGGYTAFSGFIASIAEGLIGGMMYYVFKKRCTEMTALFTGIIAEIISKIINLCIAHPYVEIYETVRIITIPMLIANPAGMAIFVNIINNTGEKINKQAAFYAQKVLDIAHKTSPLLVRKGLDRKTSQKTAEILLEGTGIDALCITNNNEVLAYAGIGETRGIIGQPLPKTYADIIEDGNIKILSNKDELIFTDKNCSISMAILSPMKFYGINGRGLLIFYYLSDKKICDYDFEFIEGISKLLAGQLKLGLMERQAQMASTAELKALQAQIHPHFLFNALNTIASFCRTEPLKARELILYLSAFFRKTLNMGGNFVTVEEEVELINSYLAIEKARFGEALNVVCDISKDSLKKKIPSFVVQPIVENSVKHGISPRAQGGKIEITIIVENGWLYAAVLDTGVGMSRDRLEYVQNFWPGVGLRNINERLKNIYGDGCYLTIESEEGKGTIVTFQIPLNEEAV